MPETNKETAFPSSAAAPSRQEKLRWYQEVLEMDPHSRIFLPYARLMVEDGRRSEAVAVLKAGLQRHPEFLEARLELLDELEHSGQKTAAMAEASDLVRLLSEHPSFWQIWSRMPGVRADLGAMLVFFSSCLKNEGFSLAEVFSAGLASLRQKEDLGPAAPSAPEESPGEAGGRNTAGTEPSGGESDLLPWSSLDAVPEDFDDEQPFSVPPENAKIRQDAAKAAPLQAEETPPSSSPEGKCSLVTRSMALVLEEQGATEEAAAVYRELLERSPSQEERDELNAKLESLLQAVPPDESRQDSAAVISMLEELAGRLEKRARS
ncbi:MAG: hypothetical protein J6I40_03425 [Mailhella sp.]|nr:hypothetical protein [Mailhella sp.]